MTISRPRPSTRAQDDLEDLLDFVIDVARRELDAHGKCPPFAAATPIDGLPMVLAVEVHGKRVTPAALVEASFDALRDMRVDIVAGAVVWIADVMNEKTAAIRVDLEHVGGHASTVLLPFLRRPLRRQTDYGTRRLFQGHRRIWADVVDDADADIDEVEEP